MNIANLNSVILLGQGRVTDLGREFRGDAAIFTLGDVLMGLGVLMGGAIFFALLKHLRNRQDRTRLYNSPKALFKSLCKLHALNGSERSLLRKTARANSLKHPGQLFVLPDFLTAQAAKSSPRQQAELLELRSKLFGELNTAA